MPLPQKKWGEYIWFL